MFFSEHSVECYTKHLQQFWQYPSCSWPNHSSDDVVKWSSRGLSRQQKYTTWTSAIVPQNQPGIFS